MAIKNTLLSSVRNFALISDSYKFSHFLQYPEGTRHVSSYIEGRADEYSGKTMVSMGAQIVAKDLAATTLTMDDVKEAGEIALAHGEPFNWKGFERIVEVHDGKIPLWIEAVEDGTVVKRGTPTVQMVNTDPELPWLTNFVETDVLRTMWYASTVATLSRSIKRVIRDYLTVTADDLSALPFMLHDFGSRGATSRESAGIGGVSHLVNFMGTDTVEALVYARRYYGAHMAAFSVPAAEHSTITSWGIFKEREAYENMIDQFGDGIVSIVSDSYDLWNAIDNIYGGPLKQKILNMKGRLVVRPDSGDPVEVVNTVVHKLWDVFGGEYNSKGFRVLNPKIRVLQGDGIDYNMVNQILAKLMANGFSAENMVFGMGGALLQKVNRDDLRFAMKCNAISKGTLDGDWISVQKNPKTDPTKASKGGRVHGLTTIYRDGATPHLIDFDKVRANAEI